MSKIEVYVFCQVKAAIGHGADNDDYYGPVEIHTSFAAVFPTKVCQD